MVYWTDRHHNILRTFSVNFGCYNMLRYMAKKGVWYAICGISIHGSACGRARMTRCTCACGFVYGLWWCPGVVSWCGVLVCVVVCVVVVVSGVLRQVVVVWWCPKYGTFTFMAGRQACVVSCCKYRHLKIHLKIDFKMRKKTLDTILLILYFPFDAKK